jgi:hypothetical protein
MVYLAVVVVALVLVVAGFLAVFVLPHLGHSSTKPGVTLVDAGHSYDVFSGQDAVVSFTVNSTTTLSGAFTTTFGITAYVMDPSNYGAFVHSGNVTASQWSSGEVSSATISDQLPAGTWILAFIDSKTQATSVYVSSAITLAPA